jgi:hypothetical protein
MKFYDSLDTSDQLFLEIDSVFDLLKQKHDLGNRIRQQIWPKCYVDAFDVTNLFRLQLNSGKRMIYTVYTISGTVHCNVLEIFLNHKEYEKRFGY